MYVLFLDINGIAVTKGINYLNNLHKNEIEITEKQYNQINEFPLKLTLDENGKVVSWEKAVIEYEPVTELPRELTLAEEVEELKQLVADLASLQLGV